MKHFRAHQIPNFASVTSLLALVLMLSGCPRGDSGGEEVFMVTPGGTDLTVSPSTAQPMKNGESAAFAVTANRNFVLSKNVTGNCPPGSWNGSSYSTGAIAASCSVTFSATPTYSVIPSATNVTASPSNPQTVVKSATQAFTVTPDSGYVVATTPGGTCPAGSWNGSLYTTGEITADCTVIFTGVHTVTPSGTNVTISPSTEQRVSNGATHAFTVSPTSGYAVSNTVGGSCPAGSWAGSTYTTGAIVANCTVTFSATVVPGRFVYIANSLAGSVSMYTINGTTGVLTATTPATVGAGTIPIFITLHPTGRFAYVDDRNDAIRMYTTNGATGVLTATTPATVATGDTPLSAVAVDPTGKFAYVANYFANTISMYSINISTGVLTPSTPATIATGDGPRKVTIDPTGKFAYVANQGGGVGGYSISMYTINASTGVLSATTPALIATGSDPSTVTIHPSGKFVYVTNYTQNNVSMYEVNTSTGVLTATTPATVATGTSPRPLTVDPTGKFAYVANKPLIGAQSISMYTINSFTGVLTGTTPATIATADTPSQVVVDPTGKFAYVANANKVVSMYSIDASTGVLTATTPPTIAVGDGPMDVAIDPTGKFAYVPNINDNTVSMFTIDSSTGVLTATTPATAATGNRPETITIY